MKVWLAKKAWTDSLENDLGRAFGYEVVGCFLSKERGIAWCNMALNNAENPRGWAVPHNAQPRMLQEIEVMDA